MEWLFWIFGALIFYTYAGYPLALGLLHLLRRGAAGPAEARHAPLALSVIISAYNEQRDIGGKIENTLNLEYPPGWVEIIVGSDGSTDRTNEIAAAYERQSIRLLAFPQNRGKTAVQNDCAAIARGEILVFTDAASTCNPTALLEIARHFADHRVGCVAGKIVYAQRGGSLVEKSQGIYWRYEQMLRKYEGRLGSMIGVDGPLYAIRKDCYVAMEAEMISDLISPLLVLARGYKVVFAPRALAYEEATKTSAEEFRTRMRVVLRGLRGLSRKEVLGCLWRRPWLILQVLSHKVLRWAVGGFFLGMLLATCFLLEVPFYRFFGGFAVTLLGAAFVGFLLPKKGWGFRFLAVPYYFTLVNAAALAGFWKYLRRQKLASWVPHRE